MDYTEGTTVQRGAGLAVEAEVAIRFSDKDKMRHKTISFFPCPYYLEYRPTPS